MSRAGTKGESGFIVGSRTLAQGAREGKAGIR